MAAAALFVARAATAATAATLNQGYYMVQYAATSTFANATTVAVNPTAPAVSLPAGDYLRFGITDYMTNNPDPVAGTAYDRADQAHNGTPAFPAALGLSAVNYVVSSSDTGGSTLFPLQVPNVNGYNVSIAQINPAYTYAVSGRGNVNGGQVGNPFTIGVVNTPPNPESPSGVATLGDFTTAGTYLFQNLTYHAIGTTATTVVLAPAVQANSTQYFTVVSPGVTDGGGNITADPDVRVSYVTQAGDSLGTLPALTVNVTVPEPASGAALTLCGAGLLLRRRHRRR